MLSPSLQATDRPLYGLSGHAPCCRGIFPGHSTVAVMLLSRFYWEQELDINQHHLSLGTVMME